MKMNKSNAIGKVMPPPEKPEKPFCSRLTKVEMARIGVEMEKLGLFAKCKRCGEQMEMHKESGIVCPSCRRILYGEARVLAIMETLAAEVAKAKTSGGSAKPVSPDRCPKCGSRVQQVRPTLCSNCFSIVK